MVISSEVLKLLMPRQGTLIEMERLCTIDLLVLANWVKLIFT
jgi:hypothetical protein